MIRFSIITPTVLRKSLLQTCISVDNQDYLEYEHLIAIDVKNHEITDDQKTLLSKIENNPRRKIYYLNSNYNDFGNTPRNIISRYTTGDYVLYLDDDDIHINETMKSLSSELNKLDNLPEAFVFRGIWKGKEFSNYPPGMCRTLSCQWAHRKKINGADCIWPTSDTTYLSDGLFLERVKSLTDFVLIRTEKCLISVGLANCGNRTVNIAGKYSKNRRDKRRKNLSLFQSVEGKVEEFVR